MSVEPANPADVTLTRLFPWLRLGRAFGISLDRKKIFLAALGLLLVHAGWELLGRAFPNSPLRVAGDVKPLAPLDRAPRAAFPLDPKELPNAVAEPALLVIVPFLDVFSVRVDGTTFLHTLLAAAWAVAVWGIVGGAIARVAVVQATSGERTGMREALRFALGKTVALVGGPLSPLLGVAMVATCCAGFGLLYRVPGSYAEALAGLLLVFPLLAGLLMTLILVGLGAGWPLMHAAVAAEAQDGFDALSRSYAYVYQRPGRYAAYVGLAWLVGVAGLVVVSLFARMVVALTQWGLSWSVPAERLHALFGASLVGADTTSIRDDVFWLSVVGLLVRAWIYAYFWSASALVYLLIRHDVDGTDWYQVALPSRAIESIGLEPVSAGVATKDAPEPLG